MMLTAPEIRDQDGPYWEAAGLGRLLVKHCNRCGERHHYPRPFCPFCMSRDTEWLTCGGEGVIYSFSLLRSRGAIVSVPAFVTLDEGPTILTGLIAEAPEALAIGQRVAVQFQPTDGGPPVPFFRPL